MEEQILNAADKLDCNNVSIKIEVTAHAAQILNEVQIVDTLKANGIGYDNLTLQQPSGSSIFKFIQKKVFKRGDIEPGTVKRALAFAIFGTLPIISFYGAWLTFDRQRLRSNPAFIGMILIFILHLYIHTLTYICRCNHNIRQLCWLFIVDNTWRTILG